MELRSVERPEIEVSHFCDMVAEAAKVFLLDACQRQMGRIRAFFDSDSEGLEGLIHFCRPDGRATDRLRHRRKKLADDADWENIQNAQR